MLSGVWWMLFQPMARQTCATAVRSAAFVMSDSVTVILMVSSLTRLSSLIISYSLKNHSGLNLNVKSPSDGTNAML